MDDARRRELERAHRMGEGVDASALLRDRLRAGALRIEDARLAAWLGHEPARIALGRDAPRALTPDDLPGERLPLEQLTAATTGPLSEVTRWGHEACMRLAIAAALHAVEARGRGSAARRERATLEQAEAVIRAAERWVLSGPDARRHGLAAPWLDGQSPLAQALQGLFHIASSKPGEPGWHERALTTWVARTVVAAARVSTDGRDAQRRERAALLARAAAELGPWILGEPDPLRARQSSP